MVAERWPRLANAPIVEAVLDLRVRFNAPPDAQRLAAFQNEIRERYPISLGRLRLQTEVRVENQGQNVQQAVRREGPDGFMFRDAAQRRTVQVRADGFTFNWLRPYDTWYALRDEAREHWERYMRTFNPAAVVRVALRYINRIELPLPLDDFEEYFRTRPMISSDLPQGLQQFFMRLEIPDLARRFVGIVTETTEPQPEGAQRLPFILDIDAIHEADFDPASPAVWATLERLRDFKNELFYGSITPKTKALCS
jgi:uncharacterized protein (TIGR04255 family)